MCHLVTNSQNSNVDPAIRHTLVFSPLQVPQPVSRWHLWPPVLCWLSPCLGSGKPCKTALFGGTHNILQLFMPSQSDFSACHLLLSWSNPFHLHHLHHNQRKKEWRQLHCSSEPEKTITYLSPSMAWCTSARLSSFWFQPFLSHGDNDE